MKAKPAAVHSGGLAAAWPTVHTATEQLWQSRSWRLHMLTPDAARCWQMPRGSLANDEHAAPRGGRARELARGRVQGAKRTRAPRQNPSHSDSKPDLETGRVRLGRLSTTLVHRVLVIQVQDLGPTLVYMKFTASRGALLLSIHVPGKRSGSGSGSVRLRFRSTAGAASPVQ